MKRITVKTTDELHDDAVERAERNGQTVSGVVRILLQKWLNGTVSTEEADTGELPRPKGKAK